jgi:hypothetical protein
MPGSNRYFSWAAAQTASMFQAYLLGCAVSPALSSLSFGLGFDLGRFIAWITEGPDTPRVVSRGRWGLVYDAVKIFMPAGAKQPVVVHYVEHMPPDVTAGIFWLTKSRTSLRKLICAASATRPPALF